MAPATFHLLQRLRMLRTRNPSLEVILSIGGWSRGAFSEAARTPASHQHFIDSVLTLVRSQRLDGVDIDWEYPGHHERGIVSSDRDRPHFTAPMAGLRRALDGMAKGRHLILTAALADGPFVDHIELGKVQGSLDRGNLMSYDFHNSTTPTTGHHAGLFRSRSSHDPADHTVPAAVAQYPRAGVPAGKIVVGVPFYGRAFGDVDPTAHGFTSDMASSLPRMDGISSGAGPTSADSDAIGILSQKCRGCGTPASESSSVTRIPIRCVPARSSSVRTDSAA